MADASFPWWAWLALGWSCCCSRCSRRAASTSSSSGPARSWSESSRCWASPGRCGCRSSCSRSSRSLARLVPRPILERLRARSPAHAVDSLVGEVATARDAIAPAGGFGQVTLRGSVWNAVNAGADPIGAGELCTVTRVDNLQLHVVRR